MSCFYCDKDQTLYDLMIPVCTMQQSIVYLVRNQNFPGRCVVCFKSHKTELFQLTDEERDGFMKEVAITAKAIYELFSPDKLNYGVYGDGVPHFHVHVIPKHKDGYCWGGTFDLNGNADFPADEVLQARAGQLCKHIEMQISSQNK